MHFSLSLNSEDKIFFFHLALLNFSNLHFPQTSSPFCIACLLFCFLNSMYYIKELMEVGRRDTLGVWD